MPALEVERVVKLYGLKRAADGVSFSVEPGELFGLLGPNGAGKTPLIRMIMDIIRPDEGTFEFALIPHTATVTTLGIKGPGEAVNLEVDLVAKYVERLMGATREG